MLNDDTSLDDLFDVEKARKNIYEMETKIKEILNRGVREDSRCPVCGRKRVKGCHGIILLSLWKMRQDFHGYL